MSTRFLYHEFGIRGYGFRDHDDFELQLYALHTTRYLLVG
jgi:hypothetical protein